MIADRQTANPLTNAKVIREDCPVDVYLASQKDERGFPIMGRSDLCEFARNPRRWRNGYRGDGDTSSTEWGTLVDALLLQSADSFDENFAVCPETYVDKKTGEKKPWTFAANACKEWRELQTGKEIVKADAYAEGTTASKVLFEDPQIAKLIECSKKQVLVMAEYADKETGIVVPVKGLIDIVPDLESEFPKSLFDFKTAKSAAPRDWLKAVFNYGLHAQGALYLDIYTAATAEDRMDFRHIVQESFAPFDFSKRYLSEEFIELGRVTYIEALKRYCRCLQTGEWPGYRCDGLTLDDGFESVSPEPYMVNG